MGNGVTHFHLYCGLDSGDDVAYISGGHLLCGAEFHPQVSHFVGDILFAGVEEFDFVAPFDRAVLHFEICDDTSERVEY